MRPEHDEVECEHIADDRTRRPADLVAWITAAAVLVLVVAASCDVITRVQSASDVQCSVEDGGDTDIDDDPEPDTELNCAAGDSSADSRVNGLNLNGEVIILGPDSQGLAGGTGYACFEAGSATPVSVSFNVSGRFEKFCPGADGHAEFSVGCTLSRNGEQPVPVTNISAAIGCDDGDVTVVGLPPCAESIPDFRFFCGDTPFIADVLTLEQGDTLEAVLTYDVQADVPAGAQESDTVEVQTTTFIGLSADNLISVPCSDETGCSSNGDCADTEEEICLDETCVVPSFATDPNPVLAITPDPVSPGQSFGISVTLDATGGDLFPFAITAEVSGDALDINPGLSQGQIAGGCSIGALNRPLIATETENELFLDADADSVYDEPTDPLVTYADRSGSTFLGTIAIPAGMRTTLDDDATIVCNVQSLFLAGVEGTYPITVEATSVDPDTGGADDDAGLDPLTTTSEEEYFLVIGEGGEIPLCGDPIQLSATVSGIVARDSAVTASDALFILRTAVGSESCEPCVCDVDESGTIAASDALATLRSSVGQAVTLTCPACG